MGQIFTTSLTEFDGGVVNDLRTSSTSAARMVTNFDVLTDKHRLIPYHSSESGDDSASTSKKQNFCIGNWLPASTNDWRIFSLGVVTGTTRIEILMKNLTTVGANGLADSAWATPNNNTSASGNLTAPNLFVFYKKTGKIYCARGTTTVCAFTLDGATGFDENHHTLTDVGTANGLVHSKDDILYVPYGSSIAKNNNGSWTDAALVLPSHFVITSLSEYGDYLAIACAPKSGVGNSRVFLWDRDSSVSTLSVSADWGAGSIKVLEEVDGVLVGVSLLGGDTTRFNDRVVLRYLSGDKGVKFSEIVSSATSTLIPLYKQRIDNRVYFPMSITINGSIREGIWSLGRPDQNSPMALIHERTPNNDTALTSGVLNGFIYAGEYCFQSYFTSGAYAVSKTDDQATYTATSIFETTYNPAMPAQYKKELKRLVSVGALYDAFPSGGQVVVKHRIQGGTYKTLFTQTGTGTCYTEPVGGYSDGTFPTSAKEHEFRIESTGGAVIAGLYCKWEVLSSNI